MIDKTNTYALCILEKSTEESYIVINHNEHFIFSDVLFFDDAKKCMDKYEEILNSSRSAVVINNLAIKKFELKDKIDEIGLQLGIGMSSLDVKC